LGMSDYLTLSELAAFSDGNLSWRVACGKRQKMLTQLSFAEKLHSVIASKN
jgi:hypothetical protein